MMIFSNIAQVDEPAKNLAFVYEKRNRYLLSLCALGPGISPSDSVVSLGFRFSGKSVDAVVRLTAMLISKWNRVRREGVDEMRAPIRRCTVSSRVHATHSHTQQPSLVGGIILCTHDSENVDSIHTVGCRFEAIYYIHHTLSEQMETTTDFLRLLCNNGIFRCLVFSVKQSFCLVLLLVLFTVLDLILNNDKSLHVQKIRKSKSYLPTFWLMRVVSRRLIFSRAMTLCRNYYRKVPIPCQLSSQQFFSIEKISRTWPIFHWWWIANFFIKCFALNV